MQDLPPIIPQDPETLQKAILVLGNRCQIVAASKKMRKQLIELLGVCPESMEQAMRFKRSLKLLAKWEAEDSAPVPAETAETARRASHAEQQGELSVGAKAAQASQRRARAIARLQKEQ